MRNTMMVIGFIAACLFSSGCDVAQGGPCDQIDSTATNKDGQVFTCVKNRTTGKGYWYKGTP